MTATTSLAASLREDQRVRWQRGDAVCVEDYLEQNPSLQADTEAVLELIWNELVLRRQRGEEPEADDYLQRFSRYAAELQLLFQTTGTRVISAADPGTFSIGASIPTSATSDFPRVPGYEIVAELGRGGMGVVYLARHTSLKRLVALKMILAGAHASATVLARFRNEAEAVARLQHANIVQIHEVGEHDGKPYLSLEYVEGGTLHQKAGKAPMPEREAARLMESLARGVHYTHQRGILHRDLKPTNILLTADGTPKITDFGVAKLLDSDTPLTRTEALIGTPNYMSPEQAAGNIKKIGAPADVYSLGAILYELLTGTAPFRGSTLMDTLDQVRNKEPVPPRRLRGRVSLDLETICLKCLEKEPRRRYASAEAFADDLGRFLAGQSIRARPISVWQHAWRAGRRRPALVAGVVAIAALVGALVAGSSYFRAADQLERHRSDEKYQQFVQRRNEAFFYGLLTPNEGALFLGGEAAANSQTAVTAAKEALALAGMDVDSKSAGPDANLSTVRKAELAADCYALLLVLASVRGQQPADESENKARHEEALRILDRAEKLGFQTRAYHLRRAHVLDQLGRHEEAKSQRNRAAAQPLEGALDHFLIGEEQYRRGEGEAARGSFDRALTLQPAHFWARFFLAVCHLKSQDWQAAKAGFNGCLTQQPDFAWAYLFRSFANEKLHALPEAEADFAKALKLNLSPDARYVLFLTRGILHFNQKELDRAAADFRSAMALKPAQYNAYLNLAQVHLAQKQFEPAADLIRQAMKLDPPAQVVAGYHLERGRNLLRDQRYQEALTACDAALELSPHLTQAFEACGRALLGLGKFDQAEWSFDQCLRRGGEAAPDVFRGRGLARMKLGRFAEAAEDYTRVLERAPGAEIYQHRGWALFFADAWKLALRDFSKALELNPRATDAYIGRGLANVMLGDYQEVVDDAEVALRRKPGSPEMMHNIACIYAQASARADADQTAKDRQDLKATYRNCGIDALRQTLEMVPPEERPAFWRTKVLPDMALTPLRDEAGFKRLHAEYGEKR